MFISRSANLLNVLKLDSRRNSIIAKGHRSLISQALNLSVTPLIVYGLYKVIKSIDFDTLNFDWLKDLTNIELPSFSYPTASTKPTEQTPASSETVITKKMHYVNTGSKLPKANNTVIESLSRASSDKVSFKTLYSVVGAESSFRTNVKASTSSAKGLFQFTEPTWTYLTTKVFPDVGFTLDDRLDPDKSAKIGALYLGMIQDKLAKGLGRASTLGETYVGYFLGPTGGLRLIKAAESHPNSIAAKMFPNAAKANKNVFYEKGNLAKPFTLAEVIGIQSEKVEKFSANIMSTSENISPVAVAKPIQKNIEPVNIPTPVAQAPKVAEYVPVKVNFTPRDSVQKEVKQEATKPSQTQGSPIYTRNYVRGPDNKLYMVPS